MTYILGISAYYHDSAASLLLDGEIIFAAQEERFSRKKHDSRFPTNAIKLCLNSVGCTLNDIDYIIFYEKPILKFDRLVKTYISWATRGIKSYIK